MGLIRPELARWLEPRREFLAAILCMALAGWVGSRGGWFFALLGFAGFALSAGWLLGSWRRLAFHREIAAPGVVAPDFAPRRSIRRAARSRSWPGGGTSNGSTTPNTPSRAKT